MVFSRPGSLLARDVPARDNCPLGVSRNNGIIPIGKICLLCASGLANIPIGKMRQTDPAPNPIALGRIIRARRHDAGLTQGELADAAGTSLRLVSEIERGKPNARLGSVLKLLRELGLELRVESR